MATTAHATNGCHASPGRKLLRLQALCETTGLSRSTVYRLEAAGEFPRRLRIAKFAVAWDSHEVDAWITARQRVGVVG